MARKPSAPWFRSDRNAWFVCVKGRQVNLGPDKAEAERLFHEIMARRPDEPPPEPEPAAPAAVTVADLFDRFLEWCHRHREPATYAGYLKHIQSFVTHLKAAATMPATALRPFHVIEWADRHTAWGPTYRRQAMIAVQRPFNWAEEVGHLDASPIKNMKKPAAERREQAVSPKDFKAILAAVAADDPFRSLLEFAWETGCRPQEAKEMEARHVDLAGRIVVFPPKEAKGKKKARRILLTAQAAALLKPLLEARPEGVLFRNRRGRPWTSFAVSCRFAKLSDTLGVKFAHYAFRHGFAQRKLEEGHDHLTVAELLGHQNGQMLASTYSHMNRADGHLRKALEGGQDK